ncbi:hypothetical protein [Erythrobacter sp. F6033]|uniref:hypothetical protein n=1 Tax=Erythrobacter sp. F6033 TaxID=2926401 RepID=UPI001FF524FC|nr:hypothetical protein [Erythrobacter sp. F6033]MCK0127839.1 hypothetical protein [Erythrobacter sp. F6033]
MFGFNKKKPMIEGPVTFEAEVDIERSCADVFPLIDISDPRFAHIARGANVAKVEGETDRYALTMDELEGVSFQFTVLERVEGERHKVECVIQPRINDLLLSVEEHFVVPTGENACRVKLITTATFDPSLSDEEVAGEIAMMSAAVEDDLFKLKLQAEEGPEAVAALDEGGFDIELDLGDLDIDWDDIEPEQ